ncbi:MAG TPA: hypothetical protein VHD87_05290 [Acidimicrobiales bacterium]|nr:hypothetical protein [Acidimicrobiales bacterium]
MALVNGWEPETPATDTLVRQFLEATAALGETLTDAVGGRASRRDGVAMADFGSPVPFDNMAVLLAPCELLDRAAVARALGEFYAGPQPMVLMSAFPTWDLHDAGFALMGHPPFMVRPPGGDGPDTPDGFEIRRVDSPEEAAVFARTIEAAYPMPGAERSPVVTGYAAAGVTLLNGYLGDRCVATAGTWSSNGVSQVNWISALPETRRRGVGAAMTWAATVTDPNAPAVLIASDDGVGVYERLGYVRLLRMTLWFRA